MTMFRKLCAAMLLVSLFALAGCPEVAQQSSSGGSSERSGGGD